MKQIYTVTNEFENKRDVQKVPSDEQRKKTFDEVIEEIGFGRSQIFISIAITLVLFTVINETMGISFIIPAAHCDLKMSTSDKGILSGSTFAGFIVSSMVWGYLADTRGRRLVMLHALVYATLSTVAAMFAPSFVIFTICRFFTGVL